jgi:hypothetical protein
VDLHRYADGTEHNIGEVESIALESFGAGSG